jgi:hypothetical protein
MTKITLAVAPGSVHTLPLPSPTPAPDAESELKKRVPTQEELEGLYPSLTHLAGPPSIRDKRAWVAVFNTHPDAMHALLADYIKQVHAKPGRIGQRPMPREEEVDLQSLIYGEDNESPLADVLAKQVTVSVRMFCTQSGISRSQYQRILVGLYEPTVHEMRMIARAIKRPPTYFVEYRKAMAIAAFINLVHDRPGIATSIYRNYLEVRV